MNTINIYVDGKTYGNKGSGFAVILESKYNMWKRSFSCGKYTANYQTLQAIKFGLLSIANMYKNIPVKIYTKNQYVIDMLELDDKGYYKKVPNKNVELIEEVRNLCKGSSIIKDSDDRIQECSMMIEEAVKNNKLIDERK